MKITQIFGDTESHFMTVFEICAATNNVQTIPITEAN